MGAHPGYLVSFSTMVKLLIVLTGFWGGLDLFSLDLCFGVSIS